MEQIILTMLQTHALKDENMKLKLIKLPDDGILYRKRQRRQ